MSISAPAPFLKTIVHKFDVDPKLVGVCAGYESKVWRFDQLAEHMIEWLPEFALNKNEYSAIAGHNARRALRDAAKTVYSSNKYKNRGELGEILLHAIIRLQFNSKPLISKIYFKDSPNDTVKGFDAVHIVDNAGELQLWLGEVKFYKDIGSAISDVSDELSSHLANSYLRTEFAAICNKMELDEDSKKIKKLLDQNESLDVIFPRLCIPVLLTYDSKIVAEHDVSDKDYQDAIAVELEKYHKKFADSVLPKNAEIILILLPMNTKKLLIDMFDTKLKGLAM